MLKIYNSMKTIFFLLLITQISFAQKKDAIISKIAEETCDCIQKKKMNQETDSYEDYKMALGVCMLDSYQNHSSKFSNRDKVDLTNHEEMRSFGEEIGIKMVKFCPNFMLEVGEKKITYDNGSVNKNKNYKEEVEEEELDPFVTGTVFQIKADQFISFSIKETSGKTDEFILLNNFNNSFLLTEKLLKPNDIVDVYYYETELFDAKINKYITYKVVTDIIKK